MNHSLSILKVNRRYISFGVLDIMDYYKANGIEYPEWLTVRFNELPRSNNNVNNFCVELPWITDKKSNHMKQGEMTVWIIENLKYEWYKERRFFYFENELDAVTFKLRWL